MVISGDTYGQLAQAIAENPKSVGIVLQDETGAPICTLTVRTEMEKRRFW